MRVVVIRRDRPDMRVPRILHPDLAQPGLPGGRVEAGRCQDPDLGHQRCIGGDLIHHLAVPHPELQLALGVDPQRVPFVAMHRPAAHYRLPLPAGHRGPDEGVHCKRSIRGQSRLRVVDPRKRSVLRILSPNTQRGGHIRGYRLFDEPGAVRVEIPMDQPDDFGLHFACAFSRDHEIYGLSGLGGQRITIAE